MSQISIPTVAVELTKRGIENFLRDVIKLGVLDTRDIGHMAVSLEQYARRVTYQSNKSNRASSAGNATSAKTKKSAKGSSKSKSDKKETKGKNTSSNEAQTSSGDGPLIQRWKRFLENDFIKQEPSLKELLTAKESTDPKKKWIFNIPPWNEVRTMKDLKFMLTYDRPEFQPPGTTWAKLFRKDYDSSLAEMGLTEDQINAKSDDRVVVDGKSSRSPQAQARLNVFEHAFGKRSVVKHTDPLFSGPNPKWKQLYPLGLSKEEVFKPDSPKLVELYNQVHAHMIPIEDVPPANAEVTIPDSGPAQQAMRVVSSLTPVQETVGADSKTRHNQGGYFHIDWDEVVKSENFKRNLMFLSNDHTLSRGLFHMTREDEEDDDTTMELDALTQALHGQCTSSQLSEPTDVTKALITLIQSRQSQSEIWLTAETGENAKSLKKFKDEDLKFWTRLEVWKSNAALIEEVLVTPGIKTSHMNNILSCINAPLRRELQNSAQLGHTAQLFAEHLLPSSLALVEKMLTQLRNEGILDHNIDYEISSQTGSPLEPTSDIAESALVAIKKTTRRLRRPARARTRKQVKSTTSTSD